MANLQLLGRFGAGGGGGGVWEAKRNQLQKMGDATREPPVETLFLLKEVFILGIFGPYSKCFWELCFVFLSPELLKPIQV